MRLLVVIILSFYLVTSCNSAVENGVHICVSPHAIAYHHNVDCIGLSSCTHEIRTVSKEEAIGKFNRDLCGYED